MPESITEYPLVYTDGCVIERKIEPVGGWAFFVRNLDGTSRIASGTIFSRDSTRMELLAIAKAMEMAETPVTIVTDRQDIIPKIQNMIDAKNRNGRVEDYKKEKYADIWDEVVKIIREKPKNYFRLCYLHSQTLPKIPKEGIWSDADHDEAHQAADRAARGR